MEEQNTRYNILLYFCFFPRLRMLKAVKNFPEQNKNLQVVCLKIQFFKNKIVTLTDLPSAKASVMAIWQMTY